MARHKIGDRVRIVGAFGGRAGLLLVGKQATIIGRDSVWNGIRMVPAWIVDIDNDPTEGGWGFTASQLEPLTPPGQKEFKAEDILTLENLPDFNTMTPEFARAWGVA